LAKLTERVAEQYHQAMKLRGLRPTTIQKRIEHARTIFNDALKQRLVQVNPFTGYRVRASNPQERRYYVPIRTVLKTIESWPNAYWRLLVAGGLDELSACHRHQVAW
jgi:hypothetical protein